MADTETKELVLKPETTSVKYREVQMDAEFNFLERIEQQKRQAEHEARKAALKQPSDHVK